jgi:orotidine-5'-phosphate decarboxylase
MTPKQALEDGADIMVIGRPIYKSDNPQKVWSQVLENH